MGIYLEGVKGLSKEEFIEKYGIPATKEEVLACDDFTGDLYICAMVGGWLAAAIMYDKTQPQMLIRSLNLKPLGGDVYVDVQGRVVSFWLVQREWVGPSLPSSLRRVSEVAA